MIEPVNPKDLTYDFTKDEAIQNIAKNLFKKGNVIAESTNKTGRKVLSFLVVEDVIYRSQYDQMTPKNASILVYPEFNEMQDCYNIVIVISVFNKRRSHSYDYVLIGNTNKQKQEQVNFLKAIMRPTIIAEVWFRGRTTEVSNWLAPITQIELCNKELLHKIIKWNSIDLSKCQICGKTLARFSSEPICSDCYSKQIATKNHL